MLATTSSEPLPLAARVKVLPLFLPAGVFHQGANRITPTLRKALPRTPPVGPHLRIPRRLPRVSQPLTPNPKPSNLNSKP